MILELLTHPSNFIFSIALLLCLFIGVLEIILLLLGGSSSFFEQFLPDSLTEINNADVSIEHSNRLCCTKI
ncbi:hypothetical protein F991_00865 [Acinetobacter sp. CIP-A165]|nr:hypothetical protein F991_00865 [Acinetobacter sp. CIP-A165]